MEIVTYWSTLITKAKAVGNAHMSGDLEAEKIAIEDLKAYEELVKTSDRMILPERK